MIFCFSGTGNSRFVARQLAGQLGYEIVEINRASFESAPSLRPDKGLTIWVFPIHSWGVPDFVARFIERMNYEGSSRHYLVCTCGDDVGQAHKQWRELMEKKGWTPMAAFSVMMPNTYVSLPGFDVDSPELARKKVRDSDARIRQISDRIKSLSTVDDVVEGRFPALKSKLIYPLFMRFILSPRPFHVDTGKCVGCGRCAETCPLGNVMLGTGRVPAWGSDCTMCTGCYHVCPTHAIDYGRSTFHKGQYSLSRTCKPGEPEDD